MEDEEETGATFKEFGLCDELIEACHRLGWTSPSKIQAQVIPQALQGKQLIAFGHTASNPPRRIGAFALPILQALFVNQHPPFFACVLAPTSELAFEIGDLFAALGSTNNFSLKCAVVAEPEGVDDMTLQRQTAFADHPHIVVATPRRLMDLLSNPISYHLIKLKYLVLDEADKLLSNEFEKMFSQNLWSTPFKVLDEADKLLSNEFEKMVSQILWRMNLLRRRIYLFSATMTDPVWKFKLTHLRDPVTIDAASECSIIDTLNQEYCTTLQSTKEYHLAYILTNIAAGSTSMIFTNTCESIRFVAFILRNLGFEAVSISEQMTWSDRLDSLATFKAGDCKILVCTDEGITGLDIPSVNVVINYNIPTDPKGYIDRVGKTARKGRAISLVDDDELECYLRVERLIEKELAQYHAPHDEVMKYFGRIEHVKYMMEESRL